MKVKVKYMEDGSPRYWKGRWDGSTSYIMFAHVYNLASSKDVDFLTQGRVIGVRRSPRYKLVLVP